ncbi:MAG: winged helix-turn-helix transcriptional regulator [Trichodesmium sp. MO_231.B1]|nr:winged helix-turn-helix transcriptional regulator [Trichodesmium sp. MO_231.B1]
MKIKTAKRKDNCAAEITLKVIGGRWKLLIIKELFDGVKRFNKLHRSLQRFSYE